MKVEVLLSGMCATCRRELPTLRTAARAVDPAVEWREIDILEAIDYAVELGVLKPPALAIDGELVFPSLPTVAALITAMRGRQAG